LSLNDVPCRLTFKLSHRHRSGTQPCNDDNRIS
jgi:hypothetical protein